jgi:opacity protein-like surface antigen
VNRHASVVAIVLGLIPSLAAAQSTDFTVSVQSAAVRKSPSTGSPIVGQAPRGAVLEVTRDIGSWVKVTWPEAPDGIGYVHQSMGTLAQRATREERLAATFASLPPPEPVVMPLLTADQQAASIDMSTTRTIYIPPPTHVFGLGAQMTGASGATPGYGFTSRIWSRSRLGMQLDLSQTTMTSTLSPERLRSTQFAPSLIYSLPDYVSDSLWLRPYFGGGAALTRSKLTSGTPEVSAAVSESVLGFRGFGGAEFTIPNMPRFAISADLGYQWSQQPFAGFDLGGVGFALSGHWYVK